jgi:tellurite resistance protein TerA
MELKQKGESASIGAFKQLKVSLIWTSAVDLDLMAFYKTKTGEVGGVYSDNYAGGTLGDLNEFPFIELSGDEGMGGVSGDNREEMRIVKLDDFEELYICALNFTDASSGSNVFADYDARVEVVTDRGEDYKISLDSKESGPVAVLCKLSGGFISNSLVNDSEVMALEAFKSQIPGASQLKLASKITLKKKNDTFQIKQKISSGEILINLNWNEHPQGAEKSGLFAKFFSGGNKGIDLDLGCLLEMRNGAKEAIQPLGNAFGSFERPPYVFHLGDDRTGTCAEGENMKINLAHINQLKRVLIYTYIYEGVPKWASTDGVVTLKVPGQPVIEVLMGAENDYRGFCAIALLEFEGTNINVSRLVTFHKGHSECDRKYGWGLKWVAGSKD